MRLFVEQTVGQIKLERQASSEDEVIFLTQEILEIGSRVFLLKKNVEMLLNNQVVDEMTFRC